MMPRNIQWYGWKPDHRDHRDKHFRKADAPSNLPEAVDLRPGCPAPMNQLALGACTAHGITAVVRYATMKEGMPDRPLARLQLYYDERVIEGCVSEDSGAQIRDGIKSVATTGVAPEPLWPYNIERFKQQPSHNVYKGCLKFHALEYLKVQPDAHSIKAALASGFPVVFGFNVFEQFESDQAAKTGTITMPGASEPPIGGHCTYLCGYGQRPGYFTSRNSWDVDWGDKGDFYLPDAFVEQQGSDFWIVTKVGAPA